MYCILWKILVVSTENKFLFEDSFNVLFVRIIFLWFFMVFIMAYLWKGFSCGFYDFLHAIFVVMVFVVFSFNPLWFLWFLWFLWSSTFYSYLWSVSKITEEHLHFAIDIYGIVCCMCSSYNALDQRLRAGMVIQTRYKMGVPNNFRQWGTIWRCLMKCEGANLEKHNESSISVSFHSC